MDEETGPSLVSQQAHAQPPPGHGTGDSSRPKQGTRVRQARIIPIKQPIHHYPGQAGTVPPPTPTDNHGPKAIRQSDSALLPSMWTVDSRQPSGRCSARGGGREGWRQQEKKETTCDGAIAAAPRCPLHVSPQPNRPPCISLLLAQRGVIN